MAVKPQDLGGVLIAAVAAASCAVAAYALLSQPKRGRPAPPQRVHVLLVKLTLKSGGLELLKKLWAPLAEHCRDHEPRTLTYVGAHTCTRGGPRVGREEISSWGARPLSSRTHTLQELMVSTEKPEEVLIFERYVDTSDLTTTHHSSAAFKEFGRLVREGHPDLIVDKSRSTWTETNVGFVVRD
jgi:hypothetical protein